MTAKEIINEINLLGMFAGTPKVAEAVRIATDAILKQEWRENPKPLTLDELRRLDGEPVWCDELKCYGIVKVDTIGRWANVPFLIGMWRATNCGSSVNFEYDIENRGLTLYRYKPEDGIV